MATTDRTVTNPIVNVLTKSQYQGITTPSADEFYLITDDSAVSAGTGISVSSAGGETIVSVDTGYALTASDLNTGTSTTAKLVSAKVIADYVSTHGGGGGGGGSGTVTEVTAGAGLNTTSADTSTDGGTIVTTGTLYLTKSGVTAGSYGSSTSVPTINVDKYGRVTSASNTTISDTKVTNTLGTTTKYYVTGTTSSSTNTGTQYFDTGIYATTTAGQLNATTYKVNENVTLQWNSTDSSLDFVF